MIANVVWGHPSDNHSLMRTIWTLGVAVRMLLDTITLTQTFVQLHKILFNLDTLLYMSL